jgi:hypothetical protein
MPSEEKIGFYKSKVYRGSYKHPEGLLDLHVKIDLKGNQLRDITLMLNNQELRGREPFKHVIVKSIKKTLKKKQGSVKYSQFLPSMARGIADSLTAEGLSKLDVFVVIENKIESK